MVFWLHKLIIVTKTLFESKGITIYLTQAIKIAHQQAKKEMVQQ